MIWIDFFFSRTSIYPELYKVKRKFVEIDPKKVQVF
jgi:hypothetical protein